MSATEVPFPYEVVETVDGDFMVLRNGWQIGEPPFDRSGASSTTFPTAQEAADYANADAKAS